MNEDPSDRYTEDEPVSIARWYDADASELERAYSYVGVTARDSITVEYLTTIFDAPLPF